MSNDTHPTEIESLVQSLDPVDRELLRLRARLTPEQRILAGVQAQAFAMASLRGTWRRRFPELSSSGLNMKVLTYLTPVRMTSQCVFALSGLSDVELDLQAITTEAKQLSAEVAELWRALLKRAQSEAQQHGGVEGDADGADED